MFAWPLGVGLLQWFIECDFQEHLFTLHADAPETHRELSRIALFDHVANLLEDIAPPAEAVPPDVAELLDTEEVAALERRVQRLLREGVLPVDRTGMRYPWPLV